MARLRPGNSNAVHPPPLNSTPPLKCRLKLDDDIKIPHHTQMPSATGEHNGDVEGVATRLEFKGFNFRFPFSFPGFRVWVEGLPVSGRSLGGAAMAPLKPHAGGKRVVAAAGTARWLLQAG
jgi:hypothetical protein